MKLAVLCYIISEDHVLMLHRNKREHDYHKGKWNGLGGKFEPGESPEMCLVREIREESGLTLTRWDWKGVITFPNFDGIDDWYCFIYTADQFEGTVIPGPEGDLEWIPIKDVPNLNLWEGDSVFLDWVFNQRQKFSANFIYAEGQYKSHQVQFYD